MTRAERRHQAERAKARATAQCKRHWGYKEHELTPTVIGQVARTRKPCSCYCCGNPRHHFGKATMQERRKLIGAVAEMVQQYDPGECLCQHCTDERKYKLCLCDMDIAS